MPTIVTLTPIKLSIQVVINHRANLFEVWCLRHNSEVEAVFRCLEISYRCLIFWSSTGCVAYFFKNFNPLEKPLLINVLKSISYTVCWISKKPFHPVIISRSALSQWEFITKRTLSIWTHKTFLNQSESCFWAGNEPDWKGFFEF